MKDAPFFKRLLYLSIALLLAAVLLLTAFFLFDRYSPPQEDFGNFEQTGTRTPSAPKADSLASIPAFDSSSPFVIIKDNVPSFTDEEITEVSFEAYSSLDALGRCGVAFACIGRDLMPKEERESIGQIRPSGWQTAKYDIVDGKYLFNRCHLIGFQLSGENANERNLITGTRYMNVEGMLPFENMVADYVKETGNHVMYRVTPVYIGNNLVCNGVFMEGLSVEDNGEGIAFHVYCYNAQPGIEIRYENGDSSLSPEYKNNNSQTERYVLNTGSRKIHKPHCSSVEELSPKNRQDYTGPLEPFLAQGYKTCKSCFS
ncbi:MAG: DNA/RNA non-specific endonuclease [Clostridia bacterium]|nr:DNA/RNA non-specific endonuclease [Clostridia bacterium]